MIITPDQLFDQIYYYIKQQGDYNYMHRDEWSLTLENNVVINVTMEDAGYSNSIYVKGLLNCWKQYPENVKYTFGDKNGLLTIAKMIGFQVDF